VLSRPAQTFSDLLDAESRRGRLHYVWIAARRPLLLLFVMGLALSLSSSDRLSVRTTIDGMISFLFLPLAAILAAGFLYLRSDRRVPLAHVVDAFFVSNAPWLLWILAFVTWETLTNALTISLTGATGILLTLSVPIVWAAYLDRQLLRIVLERQSVAIELIAARAIAWVLALGYFAGIAAWAQIVAWLR
jgi:hypothetical protein